MAFGPFLDPEMSGDQFADAPLLREIQRVLAASSGPVNWELARQAAIGSIAGAEDAAPSEDDQRMLEDTVRAAELQIAEFTSLESPGDVAGVRCVKRSQWISSNIESLRGLIDPASARIGTAIERSMPAGTDIEATGASPGGMIPPEMFRQMSSLLLGAQVGSVLGFLAQRVLGQYDVAVPRPSSELLFVMPNIKAFEKDWSLAPQEFRAWVALHEVTHRFEFASGWSREHFRSLLDDYLSNVEFDVGALQQRFEQLDIANPEALQSMMEDDEGLFGPVLDDEQRIKLARVQAFMAAAEGYGDHVAHALGRRMLTSYGQVQEAMRRYREGESTDPLFGRLLGIEIKREQYEAGRAFCDRAAEETDEKTLARMWDSAESLPSLPEIHEPTLWLSRIV
ncbi:MAG: zinc-dependent metalloprotease [Actinomycetota bacterium]